MSNQEDSTTTPEDSAMLGDDRDAGTAQAGDDSMLGQSEMLGAESGTAAAVEVDAQVPEFANLTDSGVPSGNPSLNRFYDVKVTVSAELGQILVPLGELLQLSEGSVVELNRSIAEPVDLMAQGVRIARGEVVVIDDCFAIRIKEIEANEQIPQ